MSAQLTPHVRSQQPLAQRVHRLRRWRFIERFNCQQHTKLGVGFELRHGACRQLARARQRTGLFRPPPEHHGDDGEGHADGQCDAQSDEGPPRLLLTRHSLLFARFRFTVGQLRTGRDEGSLRLPKVRAAIQLPLLGLGQQEAPQQGALVMPARFPLPPRGPQALLPGAEPAIDSRSTARSRCQPPISASWTISTVSCCVASSRLLTTSRDVARRLTRSQFSSPTSARTAWRRVSTVPSPGRTSCMKTWRARSCASGSSCSEDLVGVRGQRPLDAADRVVRRVRQPASLLPLPELRQGKLQQWQVAGLVADRIQDALGQAVIDPDAELSRRLARSPPPAPVGSSARASGRRPGAHPRRVGTTARGRGSRRAG